jgi:hypothetical protein
VPVEEEVMRVALTTIVSHGVDHSCTATVPEVVRSEDALWVAAPILLLILRSRVSSVGTDSTSPTTKAGVGRRQSPLPCGGSQFTVIGAAITLYMGSVSSGSFGL